MDMDHASTAWMLGRIAVYAVLAVTAVSAQSWLRARPRAPSLPRYRHRLLGAYDETSGSPIEGVEVMDVMSGTTARTSQTGTMSLAFLPDGGSLVRLRKAGYATLTVTAGISPRETAPMTIVMKRNGRDLPTAVSRDSAPRYLSPGLHGFEERRRAGLGGQFVDQATLRTMDGDTMSAVLRRFHGATLHGGRFVATRKETAGALLPFIRGTGDVAVYENGIRRAMIGGGAMDFSKILVDDYAAVEFYAGAETYPVWISPTNNDCGVLLLWTRER
jgi:glucose/arabinose dehydrogenase